MFTNVTYNYNKKEGTFTFNGWFGVRFAAAIEKVGYSKNKQKYLFTNINMNGFTIPRFFIPDIYYICELLLETGSVYDVSLGAVRNLLNLIDENLITRYAEKHPLDLDRIERFFKYSPLPAQLPAYDGYAEIRALNGSRGMLLDGAVGIGKTYISLSLAVALNSEITLIVAPLPTIKSVWLNSLKGPDKLYRDDQLTYLVGSDKEYKGEPYVLVHYENLKKILGLYKEFNINFSTIIVDEVHNFNNIKSSRTIDLLDIVDGIPFINAIPMSGTPIKARPKDLIPLLKIINKDFTKSVVNRFIKLYKGRTRAMLHVLKERYNRHTVILRKDDMRIPPIATYTTKHKLKNSEYFTIENISKRLRLYVEKREAILLKQHPMHLATYNRLYQQVKELLLKNKVLAVSDFQTYEKTIAIIIKNYNNNNLTNIPEEVKQANLFEKTYIEPELAGANKISFRESKTVVKYLKLKVQGEALANVIMRARIDCYTELATDHDNLIKYLNSTIKKTLVFSNYIGVCDAVVATSRNAKFKPISVYGESSKDLTRNVNIFSNDKTTNPLVTTYKSLSTGVPLIVANVVVIYGLPHRQYVFDQTIGRVWRTGQDTAVSVYIVELDTGDKPNITDRDFDIIDFFRAEVARLTGNAGSVVLERSPSMQAELGISGFLGSTENVLAKAIRTTTDVIKMWV